MNTDSTALETASRRSGQRAHHVNTHAPINGIEAFSMEFSGTGGEFFRVWIVNVLLSIVTFGLYTPFARRRTAQYFYSHTLVADSPLEFTAQQRKMVFGFLLLVALYGAFQLAAETGQDLTVAVFFLAGAVLAPWLWGSAMRFRLGSTRWRGVRLQFRATWAEVYRASWPVFAIALAWALVAAIFSTFAGQGVRGVPAWAWLLPPAALAGTFLCIIRLEFNYKSLLVLRAAIGSHSGRWKPVYRDFVKIWLATLGVFLASMLVVGAVTALAVGGSVATLSGIKKPGFMAFLIIAALVIGFIFMLFLASAPARAYREARMLQLVWNNVGVSSIARFRCNLKARRYVLLRLKNVLFTLLTLGLYRPFAMVSEYRMKTHSITLHVKGGVNQLVGQLVQQQGALGDAMADAVGLDLVG
ncbi:MAG: DUF898 domain-containing protein [Comamonadaceae bacterium]|nr:MAG: DUF898 domain-containing protein [Comamonadaceae bacterium]